MRYSRLVIFTLGIGMLTWKILVTQTPEQMHTDMQAGKMCGESLFDLFVHAQRGDEALIKQAIEKVKQFEGYAVNFNHDFFEGLLHQIKSCDVKSIIAKTSLDQEWYARFLVLYYFLFLYCRQALTLENIQLIDRGQIYCAAYSLAAKTAYGDSSKERTLELQRSVQEFEQVLQTTYR